MRGVKAWRVTGTVAIVLVMIIAGIQTWSMAVQQRTGSSWAYDRPIHRVHLATGSASVRVRVGREGHVVVHQRVDWMVRKPMVSTTVVDGVLDVAMQCRLVLPFADFGCGAEFELEVPAATEVTGSITSGDVQVEGLSGEVRMELTSGQLMLTDTSGDVTVHATSGLVRGDKLSAERVTAGMVSGNVNLNFAKAPREVDATATSGAVELTLPKGSRYAISSRIGSGSGQIEPLLQDAASPNRVHAAVTSGSLSITPSLLPEPSEPAQPSEAPMNPMDPMPPMPAR
ncbi:DUF4097 family beta strand repeat-containing protein [Kitasatospora brasiliensis]|uniref:DUF4097 family beta strand repeat-containing protein n=1 Tax=Kitasatospora brasiliensis TaxID=3058040 RepID=UPI00292F58B4|nr:DUF4097 family beta strand repeat-containing protein [Kitasatospora sp. K002]